MRRPHEADVVRIGSPDGLIAVYLNEQEAHDLAALYGSRDAASAELLEAIDRAYPPRGEEKGHEEV